MDTRPRFVDTQEMNDTITQVSNVADAAYVKISAFLLP